MMSISLTHRDLAALPTRLPVRLRGAGTPALWIIGIVLAVLLAFWLTGWAWLGAAVGIAGMVLAAWHSVKMAAAADESLKRLEQGARGDRTGAAALAEDGSAGPPDRRCGA
jgi:hypothetical protein